MENKIMNYQAIITDIKDIISSGQKIAYNATNKAMIHTYWHVGKRIVEQEQSGNERAQYGQALIDALADELTKEYGKSFSKRNLQYFRKFYLAFPDEQIVNTCVHNLLIRKSKIKFAKILQISFWKTFSIFFCKFIS